MRILPDGTVEIKNKVTGETKIIQPADLPNYGISYSNYEKELKSAQNVGVVTDAASDPYAALTEAMSQGGSQFVNKGKTKDERLAIAEEIKKLGGVGKYREMLPLQDLSTPDELKALEASSGLKSKIDRSIPNFEKDTMGGTGPLAQYIPGFLRTSAGREKVANAGEIMALYQQMISGKVVSDAEVNRLKTFLPNPGKTETQNKEDMQRLQSDLSANMQLFEIAKRKGLTINEAYDKYASVKNGRLSIKPVEILQKSGVLPSKSQSKFTIEAVE